MDTTTLKAYTIQEASELLDVTRPVIYEWLRDGTLKRCVTLGGKQLVDAESALALKHARENAALSEASE